MRKTFIGRTPFFISKNHEFARSSAAGCKFENMNLGLKGHTIPKGVDNFRSIGKFGELINGKLSASE
jgi:hypothetical protein